MGIKSLSKVIYEKAPEAVKENDIKNVRNLYPQELKNWAKDSWL
jgi:hypothetical protein